jgi:NCAIR mutase (PurE)-related protein
VDRDRVRKLLQRIRSGDLGVDQALDLLRVAPIESLDFATLDLHRAVRRGFPEVVYGQGKTPEQIVEIVRRLSAAGQTVLVTRVGPEAHAAVQAALPRAAYNPLARTLTLRQGRRGKGRPGVTVVTAGTSDRPVAEEAIVTAGVMGNDVLAIHDVGVAGVHRVLAHRDALMRSRVIVVVAGMEGALPSLVAGMTDCPVIGVPTSTGYGAGGQGKAALLAMLSSCAGGLTVVNIDNGFGAGYAAALINQARPRSRQSASRKLRPRRRPRQES